MRALPCLKLGDTVPNQTSAKVWRCPHTFGYVVYLWTVRMRLCVGSHLYLCECVHVYVCVCEGDPS